MKFGKRRCKTIYNRFIGYATNINPLNGEIWFEYDHPSLLGWWYKPDEIIYLD